MAENSGIEWTHHTFNPWIGCTKVSPACDHCYAEAWDARGLQGGATRWGPHADRTRTGAGNWSKPRAWDRKAKAEGRRYRVFCASLADVFDNHKSILPEWRRDLWRLISATPNLDWLLLTKRPQNIAKMLPYEGDDTIPLWGQGWHNVWLGTTVENQVEADRRIPALLSVPSRVRFLSCEPLIGPVDLSRDGLKPRPTHAPGDKPVWYPWEPRLDWVITGGESGPDYRPADPDWFRSLRDQCASAGVPFLFKQWEGRSQKEIKAKGRELDGVVHDGYPT